MAHPLQPGQGATTSGDNAASTASLASSRSSTSRMAKFYTPMNPTFLPPVSAAPLPPFPPPSSTNARPLLPQPGAPEPFAPSATAQTMSPNALAQLASIPGFISESAIQAARQEYDASHRQQRQESGVLGNEHQNSLLSSFNQNTSLDQPPVPSDPGSSITDLLRQLRETETTSAMAPPVALSASWSTGYDSQSPQLLSSVPEDYSNGKVTPQLLKRLADLAEKDSREGNTLFSEIMRLRERQLQVERSFFQERSNILGKQAQQLVQLQASEIMGVDVTKQTRVVKAAHRDELNRFDRSVVQAMDAEIIHVQDTLALFGVPMMTRSQDPAMIASQIRVLRLLEDMVQG
ncbi:hypothetical protein EMPS_07658 [Entomortierella parvispora]|uniref:Uncharacterized protein n=1 Tax=Entomortierella parvispora TaxID=205924 RepID=A0A9P3HEJ7_9FUNG|nr:hypothetical protein EMPS_07658 [Entomortierella parvispora]